MPYHGRGGGRGGDGSGDGNYIVAVEAGVSAITFQWLVVAVTVVLYSNW